MSHDFDVWNGEVHVHEKLFTADGWWRVHGVITDTTSADCIDSETLIWEKLSPLGIWISAPDWNDPIWDDLIPTVFEPVMAAVESQWQREFDANADDSFFAYNRSLNGEKEYSYE